MQHYPHTFSGRRASQSKFELESFISLLKEKHVKRYLEIGARHGDTFHEVMVNLPQGSYGLALDLPGGLWGKYKTEKQLISAIDDLNKNDINVSYLLGNSTDKKIIDKIQSLGPFDAILIDGDHTYHGVKKDWDNYKDLAPIIAFHDIVGIGQSEKVSGHKVEVPILWNEIKNENSLEFIDNDSPMGIGVYIR